MCSLLMTHGRKLIASTWDAVEEAVFEVQLRSTQGVRFGCIAPIGTEHIGAGVRSIRRQQGTTVMFLRRRMELTGSVVAEFFGAAYPERDGSPETRLQWGNLIASRCLQRDLLIRSGPSADERFYSVDIYALSTLLNEVLFVV
jgi:hypothetical protein